VELRLQCGWCLLPVAAAIRMLVVHCVAAAIWMFCSPRCSCNPDGVLSPLQLHSGCWLFTALQLQSGCFVFPVAAAIRMVSFPRCSCTPDVGCSPRCSCNLDVLFSPLQLQSGWCLFPVAAALRMLVVHPVATAIRMLFTLSQLLSLNRKNYAKLTLFGLTPAKLNRKNYAKLTLFGLTPAKLGVVFCNRLTRTHSDCVLGT
jgi:hypothetical protein